MKTLNKLTLVFTLLLLLTVMESCDDIIEQDISHEQISIQSPADNFVSESYQLLFWWNEVSGAKQYRIQITRPTFENIQQLLVDSLTTATKFNLTLTPGNYQWRIRGENGNSYTTYITRNFKIDTIIDFTDQAFDVEFPLNNIATNNSSVTFNWEPFPLADNYEFVLNDSLAFSQTETLTSTLYNTTLTEGTYKWKVRARNMQNNTTTLFSEERRITIDLTPPPAPQLNLPTDYGQATNSVTLRWSRYPNATSDSIFIASDSIFQNTIFKLHSQSDTFYNLQPLNIGETYYWKVKSKDNAGNSSQFSDIYRFTVIF